MLEVKVGDRIAKVKLMSREGNNVQIRVDEKIYNLDMVEVENGIYSILLNNRSYNIELVEGENAKEFTVNTYEEEFDINIVDAEARYLMNRGGEDVIKIHVKEGDEVAEVTTVVVVEAMKMQSEYKVKTDRIIKEILVKEGDAIDGNQPLIIVE